LPPSPISITSDFHAIKGNNCLTSSGVDFHAIRDASEASNFIVEKFVKSNDRLTSGGVEYGAGL